MSGAVSTRKPLENTCSPDAFRLLNQWLDGCVQGHDACRKKLSGELLKFDDQAFACTRIIDVNPRDHPAIPLESVENPKPKNFIDAVAITKRLGLRYLWIDSVCIIQDDKDDWQKESENGTDLRESISHNSRLRST
jgi:hypothetical protein